jgi:putative spermidine/putrescine transport system ATP-binding protein
MVKGVSRSERGRQAEEALKLVQLPGYGARKPGQLSGGQRQRVALARALVNKPRVLLLDEPLGALDLKLRENMQEELKVLQRALGITFVFVTHDQGEALSMADRVAVFNDGRIMQVGTPQDIYERPRSRFVADFVGSSNVLPPDFVARHGGAKRWASLRPEKITLGDGNGAGVSGTVRARSFLGATNRVTVEAEGVRLHVVAPAGMPLPDDGAAIRLSWSPADLHLMEQA